MNNLYTELVNLLSKDERLTSEGKLLKNKIVELAYKIDKDLIKLLLSNPRFKELFFQDVEGVLVFNQSKFQTFISNKEFLPDSFTSFKNKIGLTNENGEFISQSKEVVLSFPYKDCVLEGGQDKEDAKRDEIFYNKILASDEIDRLFEPKVLTNFRKFDKDGEHKVSEITGNENLIIKGNNLLALHSLKKKYSGKVNLIYIDPPFNTGNDTFYYNDKFSRSTWLTFMKNRLEVALDLLSTDGNIFIHIDINQVHYLKVLCDEVFGEENLVEELIWAYGSPSGGRSAGAKPVNIHDTILHYSKSYKNRKQNKIFIPYSEKYIKDWFKYTEDDGRRYRRRMRGKNENGESIWIKQYLDESKGIPLSTVWSDIKQVYADPRAYKDGMSHTTELQKDFSGGQKPEALIKRILEMCSDEGDIVLDYHLGTGTTAVAAHKMNRKYIGIEQLDYVEDFTIKRLTETLRGDTKGISKEISWQGGGNFVYIELKESNEQFLNDIQISNNLIEVLIKIKQSGFLTHKVDLEKLDENEFAKLSQSEQKSLLMEILDANHLYVNLNDIDDTRFKVSEEDKRLNKQFYSI